ncbi:hypothetical protein SASPL_134510 [Salvia splendens]|uniref:Uncharacterized protein n=1 Tax=Salvia splendens TaxID=180675 RepID=A0A8X8X675_SALSN|nr:hypothetical protein SASPL_134510 [Salvia splendens]
MAVASYTSRGPAPSHPGILKPDLMAPGTLVLASWVPNTPASYIGSNIVLTSDFILASGTSMGVCASERRAPGVEPAAIWSAMMTTADHLDNTRGHIRDSFFNYEIATPLAMGGGPGRPDPGLIYDATAQDYVNLLCSMNYTKNQIRTITRSGGGETSYEKQSYSLRIAYAGNMSGVVASGEIIWVEENGVHKVRSPIVVAPMIPVW